MNGESDAGIDQIAVWRPGQAAFDAALADVTFVDHSDTAALPYGVVIQNDGPYTVVAYCLQWIFDDDDGTPLVMPQAYLQPFALDDGDQRGPMSDGGIVLGPGDSRLITPAENYDLKLVAAEGIPSGPGKAEVAQHRLSRFAEQIAKKPFAGVRLAAYVHRDGSYIERHPCHLRESLQASVNAMQDVFQAADRQVFDGNVLDFVAAVNNAAGTRPPSNGADGAHYDFVYKTDRDMWLGCVERNMKEAGYELTMEQVRQRLYKHRPSIGGSSIDSSS